MNIRVLATSTLVGPYIDELGLRFPELCVAPCRSSAWKAGLASAEALIVLLSEPLTEADLDLCPNLRVIGTYSVGINHLPVTSCQSRGIRIVNTPGVLTDATADLALTLHLALTRPVRDIAARLPLDELLRQSDVLSLHCPLTDTTRGLLNREKLDLLPHGAFLINTARGGILDEQAVMELLHQGKIGGVGLDVYENEPDLDPQWLVAPRTVLLPHLGSATLETREAMAKLLCDGIAESLLS